MTSIRQTVPGQFYQGEEEELSYTVNVSTWASTPTGASAVLKFNGLEVSACNLRSSGSVATIAGVYITTPCLVGLAPGNDYKLELKFEQAGKIYECFFHVSGEV